MENTTRAADEIVVVAVVIGKHVVTLDRLLVLSLSLSKYLVMEIYFYTQEKRGNKKGALIVCLRVIIFSVSEGKYKKKTFELWICKEAYRLWLMKLSCFCLVALQ